jgi:hypothetical protein
MNTTTDSKFIVREYHGDRPCLPPDAMTRLQTWLRPWSRLAGFCRLSPATYPSRHTQPEFDFPTYQLFSRK